MQAHIHGTHSALATEPHKYTALSTGHLGVAVRALLARGGRDNGCHIVTLSPTSRD